MIYVARSKISGRGVFTDRLIRPGRSFSDEIAHTIGYNHCCDPNCIIVRDRQGHVLTVIALRFILKGEELTLDYRTSPTRSISLRKPQKVMDRPPSDCDPCKCPSCRVTPRRR